MREYTRTKHGGNKRLTELVTTDAYHCNNFQFSILEVFSVKRDRHKVLDYEQLYKKKLKSIQFGLNANWSEFAAHHNVSSGTDYSPNGFFPL